jgi:hypothetical protein
MPSEQSAPEPGRTPPPSAKRPHAAPLAVAPPARAALPSNRQGSTSADLDAPSSRGHQRRAVGPGWARVRRPTRRPRPRPRQRADVGRGCSEPNPATRTSTESSLPVARTLPAAGILGAAKRTASLTSKQILVHSAAHRPHDFGQRRLRFAWIESDASSRTAAQQRSAGCSACRPQRDRAQVALGCNTVHVVATQCMWLRHILCAAASLLCCAEADIPEGSSGDTDVGVGMDSVAVQTWAGLD